MSKIEFFGELILAQEAIERANKKLQEFVEQEDSALRRDDLDQLKIIANIISKDLKHVKAAAELFERILAIKKTR